MHKSEPCKLFATPPHSSNQIKYLKFLIALEETTDEIPFLIEGADEDFEIEKNYGHWNEKGITDKGCQFLERHKWDVFLIKTENKRPDTTSPLHQDLKRAKLIKISLTQKGKNYIKSRRNYQKPFHPDNHCRRNFNCFTCKLGVPTIKGESYITDEDRIQASCEGC